MATSWCKVASNLDSHPKVRKAGRLGREVFLFALRRNAEPGNQTPGAIGHDELDPDYLADLLMMTCDEAVTGVTAAVTAGLLTKTASHYVIVGWEGGWGKGGGNGAERTAKWRENKKAQKHVTSRVTVGDGCDASDTEEKRREESREGARATRSPAPRKQQVPADWRPPESLTPDGERELERFRNHHRAKGNAFRDIGLAWKNWTSGRFTGGGQQSLAPGGFRKSNPL